MPKYNIICEKYSGNSFVVRGTDTIKFKDTIKELGGTWNSNLKGGGGWIFIYFDSSFNTLLQFVELINSNVDTKEVKSIKEDIIQPFIETYTDKSFIVLGSTIPYKNKIKELGGTWNAKLKDGKKAWVFPETKRKDVQEWLDQEFGVLSNEEDFELEEETPKPVQKRLLK